MGQGRIVKKKKKKTEEDVYSDTVTLEPGKRRKVGGTQNPEAYKEDRKRRTVNDPNFKHFVTWIILRKMGPTNIFSYGNKCTALHPDSQDFVPAKYWRKPHFAEFTKDRARKNKVVYSMYSLCRTPLTVWLDIVFSSQCERVNSIKTLWRIAEESLVSTELIAKCDYTVHKKRGQQEMNTTT